MYFDNSYRLPLEKSKKQMAMELRFKWNPKLN